MIKIVDNFESANVVTHSGKFHADDVFSTVLLEIIFGDLKIYRTYEIKYNDDGKIYYDIGGGEFDHHHIKNNEMRNDIIPYASFGLLWKCYGKQILSKYESINIEYVFNYIDEYLVKGIDAIDNGVFYRYDDYNILDISKIIGLFNPTYNENIDNNVMFIEAINVARIIFDRIVNKAISISKSSKIINDAINSSKNHILILDEYLPYKEHIINSNSDKAKEIYFVIFKSNREGYTISALPLSKENNELRMKFVNDWAGLREEEFAKVCGIDDVIFCHKNLFVASAHSLSSAILLAQKSILENSKK